MDEELIIEEDLESDEIEFSLDEEDDSKSEYSYMSLEELNAQLNEAVNDENYELAANIRDEISKRS